MNEKKPEWYNDAKGGLGHALFDEQMKKDVIRRIQDQQPKRSKYGFWTAAAIAVAICIVAFLLVIPSLTKDVVPSPAGTQTPDIESTPPTPEPTDTIPPSETPIATPDDQVQLAYMDLANTIGNYPVEFNRIEANRIAKSSVIVKRVIEYGDQGNFLIYTKDEKDTQLYSGMEILTGGQGSEPKPDIYELGTVGELPYLNDIEVKGSNLFGQYQIHIYGVCGANCVTNNWIHFDEATPVVPISDFRLNAHVFEMDIDEDGTMEAIASESSTISKIEIYKKINGQIKIADLNIALNAEHPNSVIFDNEKRIFKAIFPNYNLSYQYKKGEDTLELVDNSQVTTDQDRLMTGAVYEEKDSIESKWTEWKSTLNGIRTLK
ncbi:hypothetical protein [Cohnella mopanensis]|uniref:hypothetical protein n=1 Tax=Cohnella mopanensis TaxID=2911966 RepID=UPI001EF98475|nr:hypothetical protein [Cohnella mopanensis]